MPAGSERRGQCLRKGALRPIKGMNNHQSDRELLADLSTDRSAFELFYRRHVGRVIRFAARRLREPADVADLTAATFVEALTSAPSYDASRGEPEAWLLGIA